MNEKLFGEPKIDIAKKALTQYFERREGLDNDDQLGMVVYPWNNMMAYLLYPMFHASVKPFTSRINELKAKGPSPMGEGLRLALDTTAKTLCNDCLITLIHDGEYNQGINPVEVAQTIMERQIRFEKIYLGDIGKTFSNRVISALDEKTHKKTIALQTAGELYGALIAQHRLATI